MALDYSLANYHLNKKECLQSFFISEIGLRHAREALKKGSNWRGHVIIAIVELIPGLGFIASLIEKIVVVCHGKFHAKKGGISQKLLSKADFSNSSAHIKNQQISFAGFPNVGHSCFMNATLQALFAHSKIEQILDLELERWMVPIRELGADDENYVKYIPETIECFQSRKKLQLELKQLYQYHQSKNSEKISSSLNKIIQLCNEAQIYRIGSKVLEFNPVKEGMDAGNFARFLLFALELGPWLNMDSIQMEELIKNISSDRILQIEPNGTLPLYNSEAISFSPLKIYPDENENSTSTHKCLDLIRIEVSSKEEDEEFPMIPLDAVWDFSKLAPTHFKGQKGLYRLISRVKAVPNHSVAYILENSNKSWYLADDLTVKKVPDKLVQNTVCKGMELLFLERIYPENE